MPGISTGRANPNNYVVGRGVLYFGPHDGSGHPSNGYIDLGNCTEIKLSMTQQDLDHMNSRKGLKYVDRNVLISEKCGISFKLDELSLDNIALWLSGTTASVTGYNGPVLLAGDNGVNTTTPIPGRWYDLVKTVTGPPSTNPFEDRVYDLGAVTVVFSSGTPTEGVNYIVDYKLGRILFLTTVAFTSIAVAANSGADAGYEEARMFTQAPLRGSLKFVQINPANNDEIREWEFHKVQVKPTGDLNLLSDTWTELEFSGTAEKNTAQSGASSSGTVRTYPKALGASTGVLD